jgi:copper chaperone
MADTGAAVPDAVPGHKYQFNVTMSCGGCSGAVERVLKKLEGASTDSCPLPPCSLPSHSPVYNKTFPVPLTIYTHEFHPLRLSDKGRLTTPSRNTGVQRYEVSLETQTATVFADESLPYDKVLRTIAKTGKKVNSGEADGVAQSVDVTDE